MRFRGIRDFDAMNLKDLVALKQRNSMRKFGVGICLAPSGGKTTRRPLTEPQLLQWSSMLQSIFSHLHRFGHPITWIIVDNAQRIDPQIITLERASSGNSILETFWANMSKYFEKAFAMISGFNERARHCNIKFGA